MKTKVGLWIDHRKAVVVAVAEGGAETTLIIMSKVERQPGRFRGKRSASRYESQKVSADDSRQRRFTGQLDLYYDAVIASIRDADSILLFGPGEAKGELQERIEKSELRGRIVAVETVDKMTDRQIAAKARQHFRENRGRQ